MPKTPAQSPLDAKIADILTSLVPQIASAVREHLARLVGGEGAAVAAATISPGKRALTGETKKYNSPIRCIAPGCKKKHGGPRSGFFCEDHQKLSDAAKNKIKADRKGAGGSTKGGATKRAPKTSATDAKKPKKRKLTAAGRKSLSDKMKARWAAKKAAKKK